MPSDALGKRIEIMNRYVVLVSFTEKGAAAVNYSVARAAAFAAEAEKVGAKVEASYWTLGSYDGVIVLSAPDEVTATALVLGLARGGNVRTNMLRALDAGEFEKVVANL